MKSVLGAWPFAITARARPFTIAAFICSSPMQPSTVLWTLFTTQLFTTQSCLQHRSLQHSCLQHSCLQHSCLQHRDVCNTEMFATQNGLQHRVIYNTGSYAATQRNVKHT